MLNEYQQRALMVTLMSIEKELFEIEQMLKMEDYNGILYDTRNDITDGKAMLSIISLAREEILKVAEQFSLQKADKKVNQQISAKLSYCWEILEDSRAKKLKRYGEVHEGVEKILDPRIDALIDLLGEMERKLRT
jgi:uncharacterized protein YaaW (UPF0174 family)